MDTQNNRPYNCTVIDETLYLKCENRSHRRQPDISILKNETWFYYFILSSPTTLPPHSTTANPLRSNESSFCAGNTTGLLTGLISIATRSNESGAGLIVSLFRYCNSSVKRKWMTLWPMSRNTGSQYIINSFRSRLFRPIFVSCFSNTCAAVSLVT